MPTSKFNGEIDGKQVKVIVISKEWKTMYFAKPKNFDISAPHFEQFVDGRLELHEDSPDDKSFRVMKVSEIWSGSFNSGKTFLENKGLSIIILPMQEDANGFTINANSSGSYVTIPTGSQWCLMARGEWEPWQLKKERI